MKDVFPNSVRPPRRRLPRQNLALAWAPAQQSPVRTWLLRGHPHAVEGPHQATTHHQHSWWRVMCLTGVDYFSTLGYQPGIALIAAGVLSPVATVILVLVTLFGALPIYRRVARSSPHGAGSIAMLERLLNWWKGKLFVLVLLGFVATDFIITITLSAADASAHVLENPFTPSFIEHREVGVTLAFVLLLGAVFLRGFTEAIGIAVGLVVLYLTLNAIVIGVGIVEILRHPTMVGDWTDAVRAEQSNPLLMIGAALILFPRLALGLSGFETGVAVMPLVKGDRERHAGAASRADPQHRQAADERGRHHERVPDRQLAGDDDAGAGIGVRGWWRGQWPRARLSRPRATGRRLRHALRHQHHPDPLVCRGLGDGGPAQYRPALPAALWHGARLGAGHPPARAWSSPQWLSG